MEMVGAREGDDLGALSHRLFKHGDRDAGLIGFFSHFHLRNRIDGADADTGNFVADRLFEPSRLVGGSGVGNVPFEFPFEFFGRRFSAGSDGSAESTFALIVDNRDLIGGWRLLRGTGRIYLVAGRCSAAKQAAADEQQSQTESTVYRCGHRLAVRIGKQANHARLHMSVVTA